MTIEIRQIREEDIGSFHAALDVVAREHKYLALLEAPPLERASAFVRRNIEKGYPQLVALTDREVVGWCNVPPAAREVMAHVGDLFMGVLPRGAVRGWASASCGNLLRQRMPLDTCASNSACSVATRVPRHSIARLDSSKKGSSGARF
jgi:hypothetical protein